MQLLVVNNKNNRMIYEELKEKYNVYSTFVENLENENIPISEFDICIVNADDFDEMISLLNDKIEDMPRILVTNNIDEKLIWNASIYFMDIVSDISNSEWFIKRIRSAVYQYG